MAREFGKSVIIGLGGSGQSALIRIKKMFIDHCGQVPPCVKLLAFDTTSNQDTLTNAQGKKISFDQDEFLHMKVGNVHNAIQKDNIQDWWIPQESLNKLTVSEGTGAVREIGRLSVFVNIDRISQRIKNAIASIDDKEISDKMQALDMKLLNIHPQVFVIGSFAGGTGSGSFFDFSILCKALGGKEMFYSAFFIMPWVYEGRAKTCYENGYASLMELEFLNKCSEQNPFKVKYGDSFDYSLEDRPFNIVNLIDGQCRDGSLIRSNKDLSQYIGECIFNSVGAIGKDAADVTNNIITTINNTSPNDWGGRGAFYSTFGVSSIIYPGREIHERSSINYAICLINMLSQHLEVPAELPLDKINEDKIKPFIAEKNLAPDNNGLLEQLLPNKNMSSYLIDDDIDLRGASLESEVKEDFDRWEKRQEQACSTQINSNATEISQQIPIVTKKLLETLGEDEDLGNIPKGGQLAANKLLGSFWLESKKNLISEIEQLTSKQDLIKEEIPALANSLSERRAKWPFSVTPARNAYQTYAEKREEKLKISIQIQVMKKALKLYGSWNSATEDFTQKASREDNSIETLKNQLEDFKSSLITRQNNLSSEKILQKKSIFEIYVGLDERTDDKTGKLQNIVYAKGDFQLEPQENDFKAFIDQTKAGDVNFLSEKTPDELDDLFMEFSRDKLDPVINVSVLDMLNEMEKRTPGTTKNIIERVLKFSTHLLPIDNDELSGKAELLTEFMVIGGEDKEKLKSELNDFFPKMENSHNLWASTGDKYRITICNYFSAVPLYVLKDMKKLRSKYMKRVYPPAHINKNFEFKLPDILPDNPIEQHTLQLLSLALLDASAPEDTNGGLISLVKETSGIRGVKYYRLSRSLMGSGHIDEEDLNLSTGKFYTLYEELCRNHKLRGQIEKSLMKLDTDEAREAIYADVKVQYDKYVNMLNTNEENEKKFTHMLTGNLYKDQVDFFSSVLKKRPSIKEMLEL